MALLLRLLCLAQVRRPEFPARDNGVLKLGERERERARERERERERERKKERLSQQKQEVLLCFLSFFSSDISFLFVC